MKHIGDLFARYQTVIKPPQASVVKEFISVCEEVTGITVKAEQCTYTVSSKTIYLQTPSIIKSELMKQKSALLSALQVRLQKNTPTEIL